MVGTVRTHSRVNRRYIFLVFVVAAVLAVMAVFSGINLRAQYRKNMAEKAELEKLIEQEEARSEALEEYSEYTKTNEFAEWYAKEKMGLIYKNEIIFRGE